MSGLGSGWPYLDLADRLHDECHVDDLADLLDEEELDPQDSDPR